jgi:hypothetical protein
VSYSSIDPITSNSSGSNLSQLFSSTSTGLMLSNAKDQPGIKPKQIITQGTSSSSVICTETAENGIVVAKSAQSVKAKAKNCGRGNWSDNLNN